MRPQRRLLAATVLLATAFAGTPALLSSADAAPDTGDRAGDRAVARAADRYGVHENELRERLRIDPGFRVTTTGVAYNIDPVPTGTPEPARVVGQSFPLAQTFQLHSKPDSQRTIYLDFNGADVSNTLWNGAPGNNLPNGTHPAMDLAGNGATFSDAELLQVQDIYQRVAEDYAPFDVDVTTEEPPAADLDRTNAADQVYGTRALITSGTTALNTICGGNCGGIAFIGVFDHYTGKDGFVETHNQLQPAWVFAQALSNDPKNIAEATTHEVGHNLGLDHDATTTLGYYDGALNDMWAPIMGVGYINPVVQFALNDYPNARLGSPPNASAQPNPDDLVMIDTYLSTAASDLRQDEPGTGIGNAGAVPAGTAYITSRTDVDYFALGTCSGTVTVNANNADVSPNLDIELQLLNAGGTVIDTDNPLSAEVNRDIASGLDASASGSSLPSGQYYARVDGIGRGSAASTYTDYGSIGAYTMSVSGCGGVVVTPPSVPQNLTGGYLGGNAVQLNWAAPSSNGGASITKFMIYEDGIHIGNVNDGSAVGVVVPDVPLGTHDYGVSAVNAAGEGPQAHVSVDASEGPPETLPGKTRIGKATPGKRGGKKTAKITWQPPAASANPAIDGYRVIAYRENKQGKFVKISTSPPQGANVRSIVFKTDSRARLKFAVKAHNALGYGALSAKSNAVRPR